MELITRPTTDNLGKIPSEIVGLLRLHINVGYFFTTTINSPHINSSKRTFLKATLSLLPVSQEKYSQFQRGKYLMVPEILLFSACYSKKFEPLANRRQQRFSAQHKQRKKKSAPSSTAQDIIACVTAPERKMSTKWLMLKISR